MTNMTPPPYGGNQSQWDYNSPTQVATVASAAIKRTYLYMFLGLLVSAFVSMWISGSPAIMSALFSSKVGYFGLLIAELVLVFAISGAINKMSSGLGALLFFVFAAINGAALAPIFIVYTATSIAKTFFITAAVFGAMSIYGFFTDKDLTRAGSILFMCLIGLIIVSLVNIFLHSSTLDWIISAAGVLIFIGLTAWDTQKIKQMAAVTPASQVGHLAVIGALNLYLDFINLFLYLLRFFGSSRD